MKRVLIIQNDAQEGAGLLGPLLAARGYEAHSVFGWELNGERARDFGALVLLGGAQAAYETDKYSYLLGEMQLCRDFVDLERPVLGLCLGAQLLARAIGGEVLPNTQKEIGWEDVELSTTAAADPLLVGLPSRFPVFHFHGDYFPPPPGCDNLASSALTACQLYRYRRGVYGFQFHVEIDRALLTVMCRNNADYMQANGYDADSVIASSDAYLSAALQRSTTILGNWIDLMEEKG